MKTQTPRTNRAVADSNGQWSFELRYCSRQLETELATVTEQRDEARKIATEYRDAFNEAFHDDYSSILNQLPWENNQPIEP